MGLFSAPKKPTLNLIDMSGYEKAYGDVAGQGGAGDYGDVETFYTPEMQQSVLAEMDRVARDQGSQAQAGISGSAVRSGFGVGNTSREMARRSNAESDMLNQIVQGHVSNAQSIEAQRTSQAQEYAKNKFSADQTISGNKQSQELAKLGYDQQIASQQVQFEDARVSPWAGIIGGAMNSVGGMMGGGNKAPTSPGGRVNVSGVGNVADTRGAVWYNPQDY